MAVMASNSFALRPVNLLNARIFPWVNEQVMIYAADFVCSGSQAAEHLGPVMFWLSSPIPRLWKTPLAMPRWSWAGVPVLVPKPSPCRQSSGVQQCPKTVPSAGLFFFLNFWEPKYYSLCSALYILCIIVFYLLWPVAHLSNLGCADNTGQDFYVVPLPMARQPPGSLLIHF